MESSGKARVDGVEITAIGVLYSGPLEKKYWSSSRGKHKYPYPIGYQATRWHGGHSYFMEVSEGPKGPLFAVTCEEGIACSGQTPSVPWEDILRKRHAGAKKVLIRSSSSSVDGPEMFGFTNPLVQRLCRDLVVTASGVAERSGVELVRTGKDGNADASGPESGKNSLLAESSRKPPLKATKRLKKLMSSSNEKNTENDTADKNVKKLQAGKVSKPLGDHGKRRLDIQEEAGLQKVKRLSKRIEKKLEDLEGAPSKSEAQTERTSSRDVGTGLLFVSSKNEEVRTHSTRTKRPRSSRYRGGNIPEEDLELDTAPQTARSVTQSGSETIVSANPVVTRKKRLKGQEDSAGQAATNPRPISAKQSVEIDVIVEDGIGPGLGKQVLASAVPCVVIVEERFNPGPEKQAFTSTSANVVIEGDSSIPEPEITTSILTEGGERCLVPLNGSSSQAKDILVAATVDEALVQNASGNKRLKLCMPEEMPDAVNYGNYGTNVDLTQSEGVLSIDLMCPSVDDIESSEAKACVEYSCGEHPHTIPKESMSSAAQDGVFLLLEACELAGDKTGAGANTSSRDTGEVDVSKEQISSDIGSVGNVITQNGVSHADSDVLHKEDIQVRSTVDTTRSLVHSCCHPGELLEVEEEAGNVQGRCCLSKAVSPVGAREKGEVDVSNEQISSNIGSVVTVITQNGSSQVDSSVLRTEDIKVCSLVETTRSLVHSCCRPGESLEVEEEAGNIQGRCDRSKFVSPVGSREKGEVDLSNEQISSDIGSVLNASSENGVSHADSSVLHKEDVKVRSPVQTTRIMEHSCCHSSESLEVEEAGNLQGRPVGSRDKGEVDASNEQISYDIGSVVKVGSKNGADCSVLHKEDVKVCSLVQTTRSLVRSCYHAGESVEVEEEAGNIQGRCDLSKSVSPMGSRDKGEVDVSNEQIFSDIGSVVNVSSENGVSHTDNSVLHKEDVKVCSPVQSTRSLEHSCGHPGESLEAEEEAGNPQGRCDRSKAVSPVGSRDKGEVHVSIEQISSDINSVVNVSSEIGADSSVLHKEDVKVYSPVQSTRSLEHTCCHPGESLEVEEEAGNIQGRCDLSKAVPSVGSQDKGEVDVSNEQISSDIGSVVNVISEEFGSHADSSVLHKEDVKVCSPVESELRLAHSCYHPGESLEVEAEAGNPQGRCNLSKAVSYVGSLGKGEVDVNNEQISSDIGSVVNVRSESGFSHADSSVLHKKDVEECSPGHTTRSLVHSCCHPGESVEVEEAGNMQGRQDLSKAVFPAGETAGDKVESAVLPPENMEVVISSSDGAKCINEQSVPPPESKFLPPESTSSGDAILNEQIESVHMPSKVEVNGTLLSCDPSLLLAVSSSPICGQTQFNAEIINLDSLSSCGTDLKAVTAVVGKAVLEESVGTMVCIAPRDASIDKLLFDMKGNSVSQVIPLSSMSNGSSSVCRDPLDTIVKDFAIKLRIPPTDTESSDAAVSAAISHTVSPLPNQQDIGIGDERISSELHVQPPSSATSRNYNRENSVFCVGTTCDNLLSDDTETEFSVPISDLGVVYTVDHDMNLATENVPEKESNMEGLSLPFALPAGFEVTHGMDGCVNATVKNFPKKNDLSGIFSIPATLLSGVEVRKDMGPGLEGTAKSFLKKPGISEVAFWPFILRAGADPGIEVTAKNAPEKTGRAEITSLPLTLPLVVEAMNEVDPGLKFAAGHFLQKTGEQENISLPFALPEGVDVRNGVDPSIKVIPENVREETGVAEACSLPVVLHSVVRVASEEEAGRYTMVQNVAENNCEAQCSFVAELLPADGDMMQRVDPGLNAITDRFMKVLPEKIYEKTGVMEGSSLPVTCPPVFQVTNVVDSGIAALVEKVPEKNGAAEFLSLPFVLPVGVEVTSEVDTGMNFMSENLSEEIRVIEVSSVSYVLPSEVEVRSRVDLDMNVTAENVPEKTGIEESLLLPFVLPADVEVGVPDKMVIPENVMEADMVEAPSLPVVLHSGMEVVRDLEPDMHLIAENVTEKIWPAEVHLQPVVAISAVDSTMRVVAANVPHRTVVAESPSVSVVLSSGVEVLSEADFGLKVTAEKDLGKPVAAEISSLQVMLSSPQQVTTEVCPVTELPAENTAEKNGVAEVSGLPFLLCSGVEVASEVDPDKSVKEENLPGENVIGEPSGLPIVASVESDCNTKDSSGKIVGHDVVRGSSPSNQGEIIMDTLSDGVFNGASQLGELLADDSEMFKKSFQSGAIISGLPIECLDSCQETPSGKDIQDFNETASSALVEAKEVEPDREVILGKVNDSGVVRVSSPCHPVDLKDSTPEEVPMTQTVWHDDSSEGVYNPITKEIPQGDQGVSMISANGMTVGLFGANLSVDHLSFRAPFLQNFDPAAGETEEVLEKGGHLDFVEQLQCSVSVDQTKITGRVSTLGDEWLPSENSRQPEECKDCHFVEQHDEIDHSTEMGLEEYTDIMRAGLENLSSFDNDLDTEEQDEIQDTAHTKDVEETVDLETARDLPSKIDLTVSEQEHSRKGHSDSMAWEIAESMSSYLLPQTVVGLLSMEPRDKQSRLFGKGGNNVELEEQNLPCEERISMNGSCNWNRPMMPCDDGFLMASVFEDDTAKNLKVPHPAAASCFATDNCRDFETLSTTNAEALHSSVYQSTRAVVDLDFESSNTIPDLSIPKECQESCFTAMTLCTQPGSLVFEFENPSFVEDDQMQNANTNNQRTEGERSKENHCGGGAHENGVGMNVEPQAGVVFLPSIGARVHNNEDSFCLDEQETIVEEEWETLQEPMSPEVAPVLIPCQNATSSIMDPNERDSRDEDLIVTSSSCVTTLIGSNGHSENQYPRQRLISQFILGKDANKSSEINIPTGFAFLPQKEVPASAKVSVEVCILRTEEGIQVGEPRKVDDFLVACHDPDVEVVNRGDHGEDSEEDLSVTAMDSNDNVTNCHDSQLNELLGNSSLEKANGSGSAEEAASVPAFCSKLQEHFKGAANLVDDECLMLKDMLDYEGLPSTMIQLSEFEKTKSTLFIDHLDPVLAMVLNVRGDEVRLCVVCGVSERRERTLIVYKVLFKENVKMASHLLSRATFICDNYCRDKINLMYPMEECAVRFSPDGQQLLLLDCFKLPESCHLNKGNYDGCGVNIYSLETEVLQVSEHLQSDDVMHCLAVPGPYLLIAAGKNGCINCWGMDSGWSTCKDKFTLPKAVCGGVPFTSVTRLSVVPGLPHVVVGCDYGSSFALWDTRSRTLLSSCHMLNQNVLSASLLDITAIDLEQAEVLGEYQYEVCPQENAAGDSLCVLLPCLLTMISCSGEGSIVKDREKRVTKLEGDVRGKLREWSCKTVILKNGAILRGPELPHRASAVTSMGHYVVMGTSEGLVHIWEVASGRNLCELNNLDGSSIVTLATNPSSAVLATANGQGQVILYLQKDDYAVCTRK